MGVWTWTPESWTLYARRPSRPPHCELSAVHKCGQTLPLQQLRCSLQCNWQNNSVVCKHNSLRQGWYSWFKSNLPGCDDSLKSSPPMADNGVPRGSILGPLIIYFQTCKFKKNCSFPDNRINKRMNSNIIFPNIKANWSEVTHDLTVFLTFQDYTSVHSYFDLSVIYACFNVFTANTRHPIIEQKKRVQKQRETRSIKDESGSRRRRENILGRYVYERSLRS